jgi:Flp pilus assembly protein CpaB
MDRSRLVTTILLIVVVVLVGQVLWQQRRIAQVQASMAFQQQQFEQQTATLAAEKLKGFRGDVMQAAQWLHQYYGSDEGLKRPDGLWRTDQKQPDFEAFGAWVIDVYLNARVEGKSDEEAKQLIRNAIQSSDEWKRVHATK